MIPKLATLTTTAAILLTTLGCACPECQTDAQPTTLRTDLVTLRGSPVTLEGDPIEVGEPAPDFVAVANDMSERRLSDWRGKTIILATVPSLDTGVCSAETRAFNERAAALAADVAILTVSMDLPFAQKRWCGAHGIVRYRQIVPELTQEPDYDAALDAAR